MKNKLILGNSNEIIKSIPDNSIDCIYTDIPYLIQSGGFSLFGDFDAIDDYLKEEN